MKKKKLISDDWEDYLRASVYSMNFFIPKYWRAKWQLVRALQLARSEKMSLGVIFAHWKNCIMEVFGMNHQEAEANGLYYFFDETLSSVRLDLIRTEWQNSPLPNAKEEQENGKD